MRPLSRHLVALVPLGLLAAAPLVAEEPPTLVHAGRLLDPADGRVSESVDVLIRGGRIVAVGPRLAAPDGAERIDLSRYTLLPGLIDSHTHVCLAPEDGKRSPVLYKSHPYRALHALEAARRDLLAGFTTLRDVDNEGADMADLAVRDLIDEGTVLGPRLFVAGWAISITGGHMNLFGLRPEVDRRLDALAILADSPEAMVKAVREQVKAGVDLIKIYTTGTLRHVDRSSFESLSQMSEAEVKLVVDEAARWGKDVAAHAYGGPGARNAVAGGVRSLEHGMLLDDGTLDLMRERGTYWSPTLSVYFPEPEETAEQRAFLEEIVRRHRDSFRRAYAKGVRIAFGTDVGSLPHGEGWRELVLMAEYGMKPLDVLRSATLTGAELLRLERELGRVAPGYRADLIAVPGRPEEDVRALEHVAFVMVRGRIAKRP